MNQAQLRKLIRENMQSDPEIRKLLKTMSETLKSIDTSIDFVAAGISGQSARDIQVGQRRGGRFGGMRQAPAPSAPPAPSLKETTKMNSKTLKAMIGEELNKLREGPGLPLDDDEDDYEITQRDEDEYSRAISMGLIPDPAAAGEEELPAPITVEIRGGPILKWTIAPAMDVFVATLDAQRNIFGADSLDFIGPNAEVAAEMYMNASSAGDSVNEVTDAQLSKPFMKTLDITKKDGKYMQDGEEKTAEYIQKLYDRREKASEKRSGKGRS